MGMSPGPMSPDHRGALHSAISRATRHLAPWLMMMYVVSFLDRANIGFAKQALQTYEGINERVYALAAGLFFLSYSLCGFPSNLILHRIGAKVWMTFLMVTWGLLSMATMFVTGSTSFYVLRLLLGVMEAGFFPGVILYLTYWFPNRVRGQMMGLFYLGVPLALIVGGPLSGLLLEMPAWGGLQGWQWMFLVEGFMAVALGSVAYWFLDNKPATAAWLPADEREALADALAREELDRRSVGPAKLLPMLRDLRVLRFLLIYTLIQMSTYGAIFYLPAEISALHAGCRLLLAKAGPSVEKSSPGRGFDSAGCRLREFCVPHGGTEAGTCCVVDRSVGVHLGATALLDIPDRLPGRRGRGGRNRADRHGQPGRISGAEREGLGR
jgi:MFS family permease